MHIKLCVYLNDCIALPICIVLYDDGSGYECVVKLHDNRYVQCFCCLCVLLFFFFRLCSMKWSPNVEIWKWKCIGTQRAIWKGNENAMRKLCVMFIVFLFFSFIHLRDYLFGIVCSPTELHRNDTSCALGLARIYVL